MKLKEYPYRHFLRHPILVTLIASNYYLRKKGILPDQWYWADKKLLTMTSSKKKEKK